MKKGIFSSWFREIATIIFTQTIQAFLLAVVMSIIISALGKNTGQQDQDGQTAAAGLLAIIALSQFGKIELLVKNIFGVTSGVADTSMNAGMRGLTAGKMLAIGGAKRLMDNSRKIGQGVKALKTKSDIKTMTAEKEELENGLENQNAIDKANGMITNRLNGGSGNENGANGQGLEINAADIVAAINAQTNEIKQQTSEMQRNRQEDKIKELTQKIAEANKEKKQQVRTGMSGVAETLGAGYGAAAGLSIGLAQGDDIGQTTLAGAGAGDVVGERVAGAVYDQIIDHKAISGMSKMASNRKQRYQNIAGSGSGANRTQGAVEKRKEASNKAIEALDKEIAKAEASANKALEKELKEAQGQIKSSYNSYVGKMEQGFSVPKMHGRSTTKRPMNKLKDVAKNDKNIDIGKY